MLRIYEKSLEKNLWISVTHLAKSFLTAHSSNLPFCNLVWIIHTDFILWDFVQIVVSTNIIINPKAKKCNLAVKVDSNISLTLQWDQNMLIINELARKFLNIGNRFRQVFSHSSPLLPPFSDLVWIICTGILSKVWFHQTLH
jgi:hypothetical protein